LQFLRFDWLTGSSIRAHIPFTTNLVHSFSFVRTIFIIKRTVSNPATLRYRSFTDLNRVLYLWAATLTLTLYPLPFILYPLPFTLYPYPYPLPLPFRYYGIVIHYARTHCKTRIHSNFLQHTLHSYLVFQVNRSFLDCFINKNLKFVTSGEVFPVALFLFGINTESHAATMTHCRSDMCIQVICVSPNTYHWFNSEFNLLYGYMSST